MRYWCPPPQVASHGVQKLHSPHGTGVVATSSGSVVVVVVVVGAAVDATVVTGGGVVGQATSSLQGSASALLGQSSFEPLSTRMRSRTPSPQLVLHEPQAAHSPTSQPRQASRLQERSSLLDGHAPPPHGSLHSDQSDQSPTKQSTGSGGGVVASSGAGLVVRTGFGVVVRTGGGVVVTTGATVEGFQKGSSSSGGPGVVVVVFRAHGGTVVGAGVVVSGAGVVDRSMQGPVPHSPIS